MIQTTEESLYTRQILLLDIFYFFFFPEAMLTMFPASLEQSIDSFTFICIFTRSLSLIPNLEVSVSDVSAYKYSFYMEAKWCYVVYWRARKMTWQLDGRIYERASICMCIFIWEYRESVKSKQDKNYPSERTEKEKKTKNERNEREQTWKKWGEM